MFVTYYVQKLSISLSINENLLLKLCSYLSTILLLSYYQKIQRMYPS